MSDPQKIVVIGAGAFGTALACVLAKENRNPVTLLGRDAALMTELSQLHRHEGSLPGISLPASLLFSSDPAVLETAQTVLFAMPSQAQAMAALTYKPHLRTGARIVVCAKGIDRQTGRLLTSLLDSSLPDQTIAILSGPGFAADIASGLPTAMVIASQDMAIAADLAIALSTKTFRLYASDDRIGVQLCGALKNVLAIASGIVEGAGLGESAKAALIARGLAEMSRFVVAEGGNSETVPGLSGLGDLVLTATSHQSRNLRFGIALGKGGNRTDKELVEGALAASVAAKRAKDHNIDLPVTFAVAAIIDGNLDVASALQSLMSRPIKQEQEKN